MMSAAAATSSIGSAMAITMMMTVDDQDRAVRRVPLRSWTWPRPVGQIGVARHGEGDARRGVDRRVQGRQRRKQAADEQDHPAAGG